MTTSDSSANTVVPHTFVCPTCATVFHCNRAEPFCVTDHPGQWHLQDIEWADVPCVSCASWLQPYERYVLEPIAPEDEEIVVLFPAVGSDG